MISALSELHISTTKFCAFKLTMSKNYMYKYGAVNNHVETYVKQTFMIYSVPLYYHKTRN